MWRSNIRPSPRLRASNLVDEESTFTVETHQSLSARPKDFGSLPSERKSSIVADFAPLQPRTSEGGPQGRIASHRNADWAEGDYMLPRIPPLVSQVCQGLTARLSMTLRTPRIAPPGPPHSSYFFRLVLPPSVDSRLRPIIDATSCRFGHKRDTIFRRRSIILAMLARPVQIIRLVENEDCVSKLRPEGAVAHEF